MGDVEEVLEIAKVVARPIITIVLARSVELFEVGIAWKVGRRAFAQIRKDQSDIFANGIAPDADPLAKRFGFRRLLYAAPIGGEFPAVIKAPDILALDRAD